MAVLVVAGSLLLLIVVLWWALGSALNGSQHIEAGGSYGRQVFGRDRKPKKPDENGQT